jgi:hypothetical protein
MQPGINARTSAPTAQHVDLERSSSGIDPQNGCDGLPLKQTGPKGSSRENLEASQALTRGVVQA